MNKTHGPNYVTPDEREIPRNELYQVVRADGSWALFRAGVGFVDVSPHHVEGVRIGAPPPPRASQVRKAADDALRALEGGGRNG